MREDDCLAQGKHLEKGQAFRGQTPAIERVRDMHLCGKLLGTLALCEQLQTPIDNTRTGKNQALVRSEWRGG
jgi:hypothetical protein